MATAAVPLEGGASATSGSGGATATSVEAIIKAVIKDKQAEMNASPTLRMKPTYHRLRFVVDGTYRFETIFRIEPDLITNKCIEYTYFSELDSKIGANAPGKDCFSPPLYDPKNRPAGVTTTDILQTLSTKLKFAILSTNSLTIHDSASLTNPATGEPFKAFLSHWRVLRGEKTLYEKYGYFAKDLDDYRTLVTTTRWGQIMDYVTHDGYTLKTITETKFPGIFHPDRTIAECMLGLSLEANDSYVGKLKLFKTANIIIDATLVTFIFKAIYEKKKIHPPRFELTVYSDTPTWVEWSRRLQFEAFEPVTGMGGGSRSRRSQRRRGRQRKSRRRK